MVEATKAETAAVGGGKWIQQDGNKESVGYARKITFKGGFVRVRDPDSHSIKEGRAGKDQEMTFDVPANHSCEVIGGAQYYFD
jgi:hypothetical protein